MSVTQQYLLDIHRARTLGEPEPPAPGRHDLQTVRELRAYRRFSAVVAECPARGRVRYALRRRLRPRAL
ncbi:hypothetical protein ACIQB5_37435 [Streptomyces sp. NPDC088560]|uniref:hypothetical protein n=1 Tax=Streptomyces sp. NPDC088560 TaxID=3365868 RepID=UPI00381D431C